MRFNERSLVVLIAGGLVVAVAIAVVVMLVTRGGEDDDTPAGELAVPRNAAAAFEGGPDKVLFQTGTALVRKDVQTEQDEQVAIVEAPNVYPALGSRWLAYVTSKEAGGDDFATEPVLHVLDPETEEDDAYGPGVAPVWNPSGTHVAYLRPVEPRECEGEQCSGATQIGVVEAATGDQTVFLDPARYTILDWAGERILVSDFADPTKVISASVDGTTVDLEVPASQMWDASPDGRWVVKTNAKKTEFISLGEDGRLGDERVAVQLGEHTLLEGSWSPDSSQVAAVTSLAASAVKGDGELVPQEPTTQVVTFSPESPEPEAIDRTSGASGSILWSPNNDAIVFSMLLDPKRALFQARHCPLGNQEDCRIVASWTEGFALLRVE